MNITNELRKFNPIERILNRYIHFMKICSLREHTSGELHHILPKNMYPEFSKLAENSWNGILLSPREHFLAHWMLWKMFPHISSQSYAFWNMGNRNGFRFYSSRLYESLRNSHSKTLSMKLKGKKLSLEIRQKLSKSHTGKILSEKHKQNISKYHKENSHRMRGTNNPVHTHGHPRLGAVLSDETKQKQSNTLKSKPPVSCPHCGKEGAVSIMKRWHFDRCYQVKGASLS